MNKQFYIQGNRVVNHSTVLNGDEKILWQEIAHNLNNAGCCKLTNEELAKIFRVSPKTISERVNSLKKKGFVTVTLETRNHSRRIYPTYPGEFDEAVPTEEQMEIYVAKLNEAHQKSIRLTELSFKSLVDKLRFSPILDEIEDNTTQFALTLDQIKFLGKFAVCFPDKEIDIQLSSVTKQIDYELLFNAIVESEFLPNANNLSLRWIIDHYDELVSKEKYKVFDWKKELLSKMQEKDKLHGRTYTREELNAFIQSVDEVKI